MFISFKTHKPRNCTERRWGVGLNPINGEDSGHRRLWTSDNPLWSGVLNTSREISHYIPCSLKDVIPIFQVSEITFFFGGRSSTNTPLITLDPYYGIGRHSRSYGLSMIFTFDPERFYGSPFFVQTEEMYILSFHMFLGVPLSRWRCRNSSLIVKRESSIYVSHGSGKLKQTVNLYSGLYRLLIHVFTYIFLRIYLRIFRRENYPRGVSIFSQSNLLVLCNG